MQIIFLFGFLRSYMVLVLLIAILAFACLYKFVILRTNVLWYINVIQVFIFFVVSLSLFNL